jgi:hypothetical protein
MYINKAKAQQILGTGAAKISKAETVEQDVLKAVKLLKHSDTSDINNANFGFDKFEMASVANQANLTKAEKNVFWSVQRTTSTPYNMTAHLDETFTAVQRLAKNGEITAADLQGKTIGAADIALIKAAR